MAGNGKDFEPRRLLGTELAEPVHTAVNDIRDIRDCFDVIDHSWGCIQAGNRGEWRLESWLSAVALKGIQ